MEIVEYSRPRSIDEALRLIRDRGGTPIAGAAWLRTNAKTIKLGVDLSELGLDFIRETERGVEIGAMTSYRSIETSELLAERFGGALGAAVSHVVGVQLRNIITIGGTAAGRYGFSDLNTVLAALGAKVVLYPKTALDFARYVETGAEGPFLIEKFILPARARAAFSQMRISESDFPVLNAAVAKTNDGWRIAVGARPGATRLCPRAMAMLGSAERPSDTTVAEAAAQAPAELRFGSDIRAGAEYREAILPALLRRAIAEVRG